MSAGHTTQIFGERLKLLREIAELSQGELASKLNVSRGSISFYENGERTPDIEFLDKVAMYFNVPVQYLLGFTDTVIEKNEFPNLMYGLSDDAINSLEELGDIHGELISEILSSKNFKIILQVLGKYVNIKSEFNAVLDLPYSYSFDDYSRYVLSQLMSEMILNIQLHHKYKDYTEEDFEKSNEKYEQALERYNALLERVNKDSVQRDKEMQEDEDYKIRGKIQDAFSPESSKEDET